MKLFKVFITTALLSLFIILISSCSTSVLVDVWNDNSFNEPPLKKIFIIAIRKEPGMRRIWEDAFVGKLAEMGIKAEASYNFFPAALPDTNQIFQTVQEKGFDGILITRLLIDETKTHYVKDYETTEIVSRYNVFRKRYDTYFRPIQHEGYVESQIINRGSIDVWVIRNDERLIWSAISNTPEINSEKVFPKDIASLVVFELKRNDIIK